MPSTAATRESLRRYLRRWRAVARVPGVETDPQFVDRVYRELLDRPADDAGLSHYTRRIADGMPRENVVLALARSDEFVNRVLRDHTTLPDLFELAPERFAQLAPIDGGTPATVLRAETPADFDWLERQILDNGYYERAGIWGFDVSLEKRVMAEIVATFSPRGVLELGCANGALLEALRLLDVTAEGIELSRMALARAFPEIRDRIRLANLLDLEPDGRYDVVVGFDIFEHLNPNRIDEALARLGAVVEPDGFVLANIPVYGPDPVFGEVIPFVFEEWRAEAAAGRCFSALEVEEYGYPCHGHMIWASTPWWERRFAAVGLERVMAIETAIQRRYDGFFRRIAPGRRMLFVFAPHADTGRSAEVVTRFGPPSPTHAEWAPTAYP